MPSPLLRSAEFYARHAFELAAQTSELERWRIDLQTLAGAPGDVLSDCCRWRGEEMVADSAAIKKHVGDVVAGAADFACLLARHGREGLLPDVALHYSRLLDEHYGIHHAGVTTAVPIDDETRRLIKVRLGELTGFEYVLEERVDPAIVGGIVLRLGDRVIDRSIRDKLRQLRDSVLAPEHES